MHETKSTTSFYAIINNGTWYDIWILYGPNELRPKKHGRDPLSSSVQSSSDGMRQDKVSQVSLYGYQCVVSDSNARKSCNMTAGRKIAWKLQRHHCDILVGLLHLCNMIFCLSYSCICIQTSVRCR